MDRNTEPAASKQPTLSELLARFDPTKHRYGSEERFWDDEPQGLEWPYQVNPRIRVKMAECASLFRPTRRTCRAEKRSAFRLLLPLTPSRTAPWTPARWPTRSTGRFPGAGAAARGSAAPPEWPRRRPRRRRRPAHRRSRAASAAAPPGSWRDPIRARPRGRAAR